MRLLQIILFTAVFITAGCNDQPKSSSTLEKNKEELFRVPRPGLTLEKISVLSQRSVKNLRDANPKLPSSTVLPAGTIVSLPSPLSPDEKLSNTLGASLIPLPASMTLAELSNALNPKCAACDLSSLNHGLPKDLQLPKDLIILVPKGTSVINQAR